MNTLQRLKKLGQSIWYDNISRSLIKGGELQRMVDEGLLGVTSNPTIFEKAISSGTDYDAQMRILMTADPDASVDELIQALMIEDIKMAADVLKPVYDRTGGRDGYVSVEVTPNKARDAVGTMEEARWLWAEIDCKNLMVKIPATREGLAAIERATYEGININATLIFSVERYREVAGAYIAGLERRAKEGKPVTNIASVASVFVSRIDTLVDDLLKEKIASAPGVASELSALFGKAAIANTKMIYQAYKDMFAGSRFAPLRAQGATVQRPLWASTGTKNPTYSDVLYVDSLVGPDTVNTVPPATYTAILDHGQAEATVEQDLVGATATLQSLGAAGIDMAWVMKKLEDDGVAAFERSFDGLYRNIEEKRQRLMVEIAPVSRKRRAAVN